MDEQRINFNTKTSFLLGIIFAFLILYFPSKNSEKKIFEEFALNEGAVVEFGNENNLNTHCDKLSNLDQCLIDYEKFGNNLPVVLWLGNSQLHVINQFSLGEKTASKKLHKYLKKQGHYLLTFSQPNSNLQEQLLIAAHLFQKLPVKNIILSIVFDDMREIKIRPDVETIFNDPSLNKFLIDETKSGIKLYNDYMNRNNNEDIKSNKKISLQENSEKFLNDNLENKWKLWSSRGGLRGDIFVSLYQIRNFVFQINPSSIRNMIPGSYVKNLNALEDLMNISKINETNILIYTAPIRSDIKIPYDINEYTEFKNDLKKLSKNFNIKYQNFENIIPNSLWGKKNSTTIDKKDEVDFMHFRAEGHDLLANIIFKEFNNLID